MRFDARRLAGRSSGQSNWLGRLLAFVVTSALVVLVLMFSAVILVVAAVVGLVLWAYLAWKMRQLRQRMAAAMAAGMAGEGFAGPADVGSTDRSARSATGDAANIEREARIIDGEVIRTSDEALPAAAEDRPVAPGSPPPAA